MGKRGMKMNTKENVMVIRGREYTVEATKDNVYWLTGKRGAKYYTVRTVPHPHQMFIIPENFLKSNVLERVWLSDESGELRVVKD